MNAACHDVSELLTAWKEGDPGALNRLMPLIYDELRIKARGLPQGALGGQPMQPTAIVHEVYLRLLRLRRIDMHDRNHFLALAARIMRGILVDHVRAGHAQRRERALEVTLDERLAATPAGSPIDLLALDLALQRLEATHPQYGRLVELRFFGGLTIEEAADVLNVSARTVDRNWRLARAWLFRELEPAAARACATLTGRED